MIWIFKNLIGFDWILMKLSKQWIKCGSMFVIQISELLKKVSGLIGFIQIIHLVQLYFLINSVILSENDLVDLS